MFKKLLYFFRKTSSHTPTNTSANTVAQINTTNVDSLDNSVDKIIEEIEQTFTDWQHTGLSSIHPTEIEQCEALLEKLAELEQEQSLENNKSQCLTAQLNNIKTTMQVFSNKNNTASDNIEQTDIKPFSQKQADEEQANNVADTANMKEQTFTKESQQVEAGNTQQRPEVATPFKTADTIEKAYPVEIATTTKTAVTSTTTEPLASSSITDESTVDKQDNYTTSEVEDLKKIDTDNSEQIAAIKSVEEPVESVFNDETIENQAVDNIETPAQPCSATNNDIISEQIPEAVEKRANNAKQDTKNNSKDDTLVYLPKLTLKTPLVCLEQAQIAESSSEYKKLPKRTKNTLDKHGEWVSPSAELPYQTDITVEDKPAYLAFLQQLLVTLENKQLTPEQKVAELTKVEKQENWQLFVTSHFGNDEDWKITKSIEQEVKSIKGISTKLAVLLFKQGYTSKQAICNAPDDVLLALPRVGKATLEKIRNSNQ
ncbi:helix-hairpin-helix domain-containing protein [Spartinivicinus poritis]|uniref:Helix-hairpin-helix domain-containing protein n=1 Tax=Spartinivicinus poritis TaxID=2994640 RepID=A0ABT5UAB1_9GAMM|nr:helix-hairpin-helix domain-containing protein [Spartinivicinus sp. A2-2]MDE1462492.1 helix-hairpin-helix domain-containing protein [Spartinivicinus sp. A2-2]